MPVSLLPVSQYRAVTLLVMLMVGGALAGLVIRLVRRRFPTSDGAAAAGVLLVQAAAILQSFVVVAEGLGLTTQRSDTRAQLYFAGMLAGSIVSAALAQGLFWLISRRSAGPAALGIACAAVPFTSWLVGGIGMLSGPEGAPLLFGSFSRWLPGVIVGVALGWCGVIPLRRLGVWAASLVALAITPAVFTAVSNALGMRVLDGDLREMADVAARIFPLAFGLGVPPVLLALLLGAAIVAVRWVIGRSRARNPEVDAARG